MDVEALDFQRCFDDVQNRKLVIDGENTILLAITIATHDPKKKNSIKSAIPTR